MTALVTAPVNDVPSVCGLTACVALGAAADVDEEWVRQATGVIAHRGPDDDGFYGDEHCALGFRRLAVLDPSAAGHQPMCSRDGRYWIVFNGEIYNYLELAERLSVEGLRLRSRSDTEVLLELFARAGEDVVHDLRGMYAFAIWDVRRRELFAARDRFGIKPLFYEPRDGLLRLASEKKALLDRTVDTPADLDALRHYLSFQFVPPPATLSPSIQALPPGHTLTVRAGGDVEVRRYWRANLRPASRSGPDTTQKIASALRDSVHLHLRSDVPLGAFLSGGIDSAAICALAAEERPGLLTFTVGFEREDYSEIERAQDTADALGLELHPYVVTPEEFMECLPRITWHLDDPLADASAVPLWFVAREARKHVKVVLSGEGSDELFSGYHRELSSLTDERCSKRYIGPDHIYLDEEVDRVAGGGGGGAQDVVAPLHREAQEQGLDAVTTMQLIDINTWLVGDILVKADRMTMAHGLELRVPFLDREVMAVASRLARQDKVTEDTTKRALRRAMTDLLPAAVAERPKLGFPVPMAHWLRDELYEFAHELLRETDAERYIRRSVALDLLQRYRAGEDFDWRRLWVLVTFCLWHQVYVERRYDPVALGWDQSPRVNG
jgi:asparagine synthase (glutamine-hydrolysing)